MTYQDALDDLESLTNYERTHQPSAMRAVRLERMQRLCARLGHPQRRFRSILVGGTNAKGSVCAMIYAMLRTAGIPAGLYTSPHLTDVRERIRVSRGPAAGSDWIAEEAFTGIIAQLRPLVEEFRGRPDGPLTYFEVMTAAAFLHFAQARIRVAVLEVGLGGRLDATNVVEPSISLLGPIGLDHTDVLGEDEVTIAQEKAGILRPDGVAISAPQSPAVSSWLRAQALLQQCRWLEVGRELSVEVHAHDAEGLRLTIQGRRGRYDDLRVPLLGRHQAENAALAVAAVEELSAAGVPHQLVREGLAAVEWPGRIEVLQDDPLVLVDGAHNAPAARALRATIEELWPGRRVHLVVGMSADKPIAAVAEVLSPLAASVICTSSGHPRACEPARLATWFGQGGTPAIVMDDPLDALTYRLNTADRSDVIVVTGSLFLAGAVRRTCAAAQLVAEGG